MLKLIIAVLSAIMWPLLALSQRDKSRHKLTEEERKYFSDITKQQS